MVDRHGSLHRRALGHIGMRLLIRRDGHRAERTSGSDQSGHGVPPRLQIHLGWGPAELSAPLGRLAESSAQVY
jgi:hypothetical protein